MYHLINAGMNMADNKENDDALNTLGTLDALEYKFFLSSPEVHDYKFMVQEPVALEQNSAVVAKIGRTDKQLTDADGAVISYPLWQILPESVAYTNGVLVNFAYNADGDVIKITEEPGYVWTLDTSIESSQRFKRWLRNDKKILALDVVVLPDGNYQICFENGDVLTCTTSGKRLLSRPFPQNFDLQQSLVRVFKELDPQNLGAIDKGQINRGVTQHWKENDDAQLVTMLKLHYEVILLTREKAIFKIGKGLSKDDITRYDRICRSILNKDTSTETLKTINALFDAIDTNNDQNISLDEIANNFESGKFNASQTTSLSYIINHSQKLHAFTQNGYVDRTTRMTRSEFIQHYKDVFREQVVKYQTAGGWGIDQMWQQTLGARRTLYADMQHPHASLRIEAIKQGMVGDCLFLAAMASLISVRPAVILQSIVPNDNGTYTVTFLGAPDAPIAVLPPTTSELALYAKGSEYGIWAPLMEKAYGLLVAKRRNLGSVIPAENTASRENMKSLEILGGRQTRWEYTQDSMSRALGMCKQSMNENELRNLLINCFAQNRAIIAAALKGALRDKDEPAICSMHAYSVIDFDANANVVTVRNPWGIVSKQGLQTELHPLAYGMKIADDGTDGVFKLPLKSFAKKFEALCVESR